MAEPGVIPNAPDDRRAYRCGHNFVAELCPFKYCYMRDAVKRQEADDRREAEEDAKIYAEGKKAGGRERAVKELRQLADRIETLGFAGVCAGVRRRAAEIEAEEK